MAEPQNLAGDPDVRSNSLITEEDLAFAAAASSSKKLGEVVWLPGRTRRLPSRFRGHGEVAGGTTDLQTVGAGAHSADAVKAWIFQDDRYKKIVEYMRKAGYPVATMDFNDIAQFWGNAVDGASATYMTSDGRIKKSPWDVLSLMAPSADGKDKSPYSLTQIATTVDEIAPEQARAVLRKTFSEMLGRAPDDDGEVDDFAARISRLALENPEVTTTTRNMVWDERAGGFVEKGSSSRRSGGVTAEMLQAEAEEDAKEDPEYEVATAAQFYAPALFQALASPVDM